MRSLKWWCIFLLFVFTSSAYAAKYREIVLKDGSTFYAEIVGFQEGIYTLHVKDLGVFKVAEWNIDIIHFKIWDEETEQPKYGERRIVTLPRITDQRILSMQSAIMQRPELMKQILVLPNNPNVQKVLNDIDLMKAIYFDDWLSVFASPVINELLRDPTVQSIVDKATLLPADLPQDARTQTTQVEHSDYTPQVQSFQSQMVNNASIMQKILTLQAEPTIQHIVNNPELMKAVQAFDLDALMKNPEFTQLFNNAAIQDILHEVLR